MRAISLGLQDDVDCDLNNACVFGHDGLCASECDECEGSGVDCSCHGGLVWWPCG
jgi:hypothetical protein